MRAALAGLALFLFASGVVPGDAQVIFEDSLKGNLGEGWSWLREHTGAWRHTRRGLEIRVEPGGADTVKNALLRKAPDRSQAEYTIDLTVEQMSPPSQQYEQAGLTWYQGDRPVFKLVHELVDGKPYIIPGKKATDTRLVQLRLVVSKDRYVAKFRPDARGEFQTAATGKLPPGENEKISIQCYHGPSKAEHRMRFSDFKIYKR
jgi:hypothetical protein